MEASEQDTCVNNTPRAERIAQLNDELRKGGRGGIVVATRDVRALEGFNALTLLTSLARYDSFDPDNDPHGERDFGDLQYLGAELLWKIDCYDNQMEWASPDPANSSVTIRVLTVMLAREY